MRRTPHEILEDSLLGVDLEYIGSKKSDFSKSREYAFKTIIYNKRLRDIESVVLQDKSTQKEIIIPPETFFNDFRESEDPVENKVYQELLKRTKHPLFARFLR